MGEARTAEAAYLLDWAEALDPTRADVPVLLGVVDYLRAAPAQRRTDARGLRSVLFGELQRNSHDRRLRLCYALVLVEDKDFDGARKALAAVREPNHPLALRAEDQLRKA